MTKSQNTKNGQRLNRELEQGKKMQGFPDWYEFPVSNRQAMKQLGNSVAVPAVQAVAGQIVKYLNGEDLKECK